MYLHKTIGAVVRAYNEEKHILSVIESMPEYVDKIYVVNDASSDSTLEIIMGAAKRNSKIVPVARKIRGGAGSAAVSGLKRALQDDVDIFVMLDGDGQMDTSLINHFLDPLVFGKADYVKGSRLSSREHMREMPAFRAFGNCLLTFLTRAASGYWHISDPQNGYTAISRETLSKIKLDKVEKGFAFENDMLVKLNAINARVMDIPHPAVYRGQQSKIHYPGFILSLSWVLLKDYFWRIRVKYLRGNIRKFEKETGVVEPRVRHME
jgi:glycosyltransferase involved in cell wall biosynthesis